MTTATTTRPATRGNSTLRAALSTLSGALLGAALAAALLWVGSMTPDGVDWLVPRLVAGIERHGTTAR